MPIIGHVQEVMNILQRQPIVSPPDDLGCVAFERTDFGVEHSCYFSNASM
jgi:hypothetical protein